MSTILVTGGAGFIGSHISKKLLERGAKVVIIDNFCNYYSTQLKWDRINSFIGSSWQKKKKLFVYKENLADFRAVTTIFNKHKIDKICHMAAQAGVRYYFEKKDAFQIYKQSNLDSFLNLIELAKKHKTGNFVFASTSSVYGNTKKFPFKENHSTDYPLSLYAATKKSSEVIAHTYSYLFGLKVTGLRFFNVYGPWGRPDGAYYKWARLISQNKPIDLYGYGKQQRDWTYINDIVEGVMRVLDKPKKYEIYNIGRGRAENLMEFLGYIEEYLGKTAKKKMLPLQPGEVTKTFCSTAKLKKDFGYKPKINIEEGVKKFINWYKKYHCIK